MRRTWLAATLLACTPGADPSDGLPTTDGAAEGDQRVDARGLDAALDQGADAAGPGLDAGARDGGGADAGADAVGGAGGARDGGEGDAAARDAGGMDADDVDAGGGAGGGGEGGMGGGEGGAGGAPDPLARWDAARWDAARWAP